MKHIPTLPKIVLNILLYFFYVLVISLIFSFVFPQVLVVLGRPIPDSMDPVFYKTQIIILVLVLVVTLIARKYVYISLGSEEEITKHKKNPSANKKKDIKNIKEKKEPENFEEEMKIYIDKEIK